MLLNKIAPKIARENQLLKQMGNLVLRILGTKHRVEKQYYDLDHEIEIPEEDIVQPPPHKCIDSPPGKCKAFYDVENAMEEPSTPSTLLPSTLLQVPEDATNPIDPINTVAQDEEVKSDIISLGVKKSNDVAHDDLMGQILDFDKDLQRAEEISKQGPNNDFTVDDLKALAAEMKLQIQEGHNPFNA